MKMFQVDAFADRVGAGNPAAVVLLDAPLPDSVLSLIAAENNLSETAYITHHSDDAADFGLRWFTPTVEVDLCGHATLAAAHVLFRHRGVDSSRIRFATQSGIVTVTARDDDRLELDFPARPGELVTATEDVAGVFGCPPRDVRQSRDLMCVFDDPAVVEGYEPDIGRLGRLADFGVIITAPGAGDVDFVSRYFAPNEGVSEDPVTGSAHCTLVPYWSARLGRADVVARQISERGGTLWCRLDGDRVRIAGTAVTFMEATITAPLG